MSPADKKKIVSIMKETCSHAYLATVDGDQPRVRPVSPIVEDDMSIWVTTFRSSRKVRQLEVNPKICLAFIEQPSGDKAAIVTGAARIIEDIKAKQKVWNIAGFDLAEYFPKGPEDEEYCLLKIIPSRIEWRDSWAKTKVYEPG
jgi:general stress protein 26